MLKMDSHLDGRTVKVNSPNLNIETFPEEQFFTLLHSGRDVGNVFPIPDGLDYWNDATIEGISVLACAKEEHLYIICEDVRRGLALFHYVNSNNPENSWDYKLSYDLPFRVLKKKGVLEMANALSDLANMSGRGGLRNLNLQGDAPAMQEVGSGVASAVDARRLQREALSSSYVAGYIMGGAPAITLSMATQTKDGVKTYTIKAKESKPARMQGVLIAIPARCCMHAGSLASPSDIMAGSVDFNTSDETMICQFFPTNAAIAYIAALGGKLPEYAPHVSKATRQWTKEEIFAEKEEVSFVRVRATENKRRSMSDEQFRFSLQSTSPRRSLFTQKNHCCLRALEHMSTACKSDKDAYLLNQAAFGDWAYRRPATDTRTTLEKAKAECPSMIWGKVYVIDGEEHSDGIGSAFFMAEQTDVTESGETIAKKELVYYPWYQTGANRPDAPSIVPQIVKRTLRPAEGNKSERVVTSPVLYKDKPNHPMFRQYAAFIEFALQGGYLREDQLNAMCGRGTSRKKQAGLSSDQMDSLKSFLRSDVVSADILAVQDSANDAAILRIGR